MTEKTATAQPILIFSTCPSEESQRIANALVDQGVAACVNTIETVHSTYLWEGQRQQSDESLLMIKSHTTRYNDLEQALKALHPYELPEIIAVPITAGLPAYLQWIDQVTELKCKTSSTANDNNET